MNLKHSLKSKSLRWFIVDAFSTLSDERGFISAALGMAASAAIGGGLAGSIASTAVSTGVGMLTKGVMGGGSSDSSSAQASSGNSSNTPMGILSQQQNPQKRANREAKMKQAQQDNQSSAEPVGLKDALSTANYKSDAFNLDQFNSKWATRLDGFGADLIEDQ